MVIRPRSWRRRSLRVAAALAFALALWTSGRGAWGFDLAGHEITEAAAYRRILSLSLVPGTQVSGRKLLATLIADGVLDQPPCFDLDPRAGCRLGGRLDSPIAYWPVLGSGALDLIIDRQLGQEGQCQHFMARTADGLTPLDPRLGVPTALATTAYTRCALILGLAFDGILRAPRLANWRMSGAYALIHGIQDSFSAAHAARDEHWKIIHLLSWKLIDWPSYFRRGLTSFPPATHHHVTDDRDRDYLRLDGRTEAGARCEDLANPYAMPESCLTARALMAVAAIADLLVDMYQIRDLASREGRTPTLANPNGAAIWREYLSSYLASAETSGDLVPTAPREGRRRPDVFVGALASAKEDGWGLGLWGARLMVGPAIPFALTLSGGAGYTHVGPANHLGASVGVGLLLPLVGRFAIGATPAGVELQCDTSFDACALDPVATLGNLLVPLGAHSWVAIEGPRWSWTDRALTGTLFGLAVGWAHERKPDEGGAPLAEAAQAWNPPSTDEVSAFRRSRGTFVAFATTTAASSADNAFVGAGLAWRLDRDHWDRRSGSALGLGLEIVHGHINGTPNAGAISAAPMLAAYLVPNRLAVTAIPALVQLGHLTGPAFGVDVAGRAGVAFDFGNVELAVDSPPLSYLSRQRWHALPLSVRLGLLFD